ncbi:hypothetical protein NTGBS_70024 [Candidatus Nitrotoga sp. BS]|nr:hypothetical protein NTGBS_70024 [Candidatus Nitrotoga sp. BS]
MLKPRLFQLGLFLAQSTSFLDMARVLFGLRKTTLKGFGSLFVYSCQDAALLPIGSPKIE